MTEIENKLRKEIIDNQIPVTTFIMLTSKCNFFCKHCFVSPEKNKYADLKLEQWKNILDILKQKGTVNLVISGGEPLLNKNFIEIYKYAYQLKFHIIIFTNASLLTKEHLNLFNVMPPKRIEVTIYGSSSETYFNFCGIKIDIDVLLNNIRMLVTNGINVKIKTIANKFNYLELSQIKNFCSNMGKKLNIYRNISCDVMQDYSTTDVQLSKEQIIKTFEINDDFCRIFVGFRKKKLNWEKGYLNCGAGISSCHIDHLGNLYLCNRCFFPKYSIFDGFDPSWKNIKIERQKQIEVFNICSNCKQNKYCGKCSPHINSLNDKYEECINFNEMIQALNIPIEKCLQYTVEKTVDFLQIGKYYILQIEHNRKGYVLNDASKKIVDFLFEGYTVYEIAMMLNKEQNEDGLFNKILDDVKSIALVLEKKGIIKKTLDLKY